MMMDFFPMKNIPKWQNVVIQEEVIGLNRKSRLKMDKKYTDFSILLSGDELVQVHQKPWDKLSSSS